MSNVINIQNASRAGKRWFNERATRLLKRPKNQALNEVMDRISSPVINKIIKFEGDIY